MGNKATRLLLQLSKRADEGAVLEIDVRSDGDLASLWALLTPLVEAVRLVLDEFPGMQTDERLVCLLPCRGAVGRRQRLRARQPAGERELRGRVL